MPPSHKELREKYLKEFNIVKPAEQTERQIEFWLSEYSAREERLIEEIEEMKGHDLPNEIYSHEEFYESGYNEALDDIINIIKNNE